MKSPALIARLVQLEAKIDPILFRKRPDDDYESANDSKSVAGSLAALGLAGGAYAGHRAVKSAGGYKVVGKKVLGAGAYAGGLAAGHVEGATKAGMGAAKDFLQGRKAAAVKGAGAGRAAGMNLAEKAGGLVDKAAIAAPQYASKAAMHVATGVQAAKTGALDVIKSLKKKLPMLVPHLAKMGLQEHFNGKLVELDQSLDSFLAARKEQKAQTTRTRIAGAATAGVAGAVAHTLIKRKGGYGAMASRLMKMAA